VFVPQNAQQHGGEHDRPRQMTEEERKWWSSPYRMSNSPCFFFLLQIEKGHSPHARSSTTLLRSLGSFTAIRFAFRFFKWAPIYALASFPPQASRPQSG
jgi:hypothetical protein